MARDGGRQNSKRVSGKVRFIMLEADIEDGNLSEIAQAISNAVRAAPVIQQVIQAPSTHRALESRFDGKSDHLELPSASDIDDHDFDSEAEVSQPASRRQGRDDNPRTYAQPKPINGINWAGDGTTFRSFAEAKNPTSHVRRYLVIAAWFRRHNDLPSVSIEHVFTAYGMMKWGWETGKDMGMHFREGMRPKRRWYESDGKGQYEITDLGLNEVDHMGAPDEGG